MRLNILKSSRGSIFFLSMWTLVFLSILALISGTATRQQILLLEKIEERNKLYNIAEAGIFKTIDFVMSYGISEVNSYSDPWIDSEEDFKDIKFMDGQYNIEYDFLENIWNRKDKKYGVIDENRKININKAVSPILVNLFSIIGGLDIENANKLANAVIDWRDDDDNLYGYKEEISESLDYINDRYAYTPKNEEFVTLEEVLLVKGMDISTYLKVRDYITVYSEGQININTASREVLLTVGLDNDLVDKIVEYRSGANRVEGDLDDNVFTDSANIAQDLCKHYDLSEEEQEAIIMLASGGIIDVYSDSFMALCTSSLANSRLYGKIICVFSRTGNIKYWSTKFSAGKDT